MIWSHDCDPHHWKHYLILFFFQLSSVSEEISLFIFHFPDEDSSPHETWSFQNRTLEYLVDDSPRTLLILVNDTYGLKSWCDSAVIKTVLCWFQDSHSQHAHTEHSFNTMFGFILLQWHNMVKRGSWIWPLTSNSKTIGINTDFALRLLLWLL